MRRLATLVALTIATASLQLASAGTGPATADATSAGIWTAVPSGLGSGDTIRAIDYQSPTRMWLATTSGKVATRQASGTFTVATVTSAVNGLNDIAFKPGDSTGIAVGNNGTIYRMTGTTSWTRVDFTEKVANTGTTPDEKYNCGHYNPAAGSNLNDAIDPPVTLYSVHWGAGSTVLITGAYGIVLRSDNNGASFTEINHYVRDYSSTDSTKTIGCRLQASNAGDIFDAQFASPTDNNSIYFKVDGGPVIYTDAGLAASGTPVQTSATGCDGVFGRLALSQAAPVTQWATTDYGGAGDAPCFYFTTSSAPSSSEGANYVNGEGATRHNGTDVAVGGNGSSPTVVLVGLGGDILNSTDGRNFYVNKVTSTDTTNWYAVSGFDPQNFAVGGTDGKLVISTRAATLPDIVAPTGVISGPVSAVAGRPTTYTANLVDEAGGSGINPASIRWSSAGTAGGAGNPVSLTFPSAGYYSVRVDFADLAGNASSATLGVTVTSASGGGGGGGGGGGSASVGGGTVTLVVPASCVKSGSSFKTKVKAKRGKGKTATLIGVSKLTVSVDGKKAGAAKKAPFKVTVSTKGLAPGVHQITSKTTVKLAGGKKTSAKLSSTFSVC